MTADTLTLVSHALCPYVQRAAIVLLEKGAAFERREVDLSAKPAWFNAISPLGRTPVLLVGSQALFESAAICEYLDDTVGPRLHPQDALERARHRGWMEFASAVLDTIAAFYNAPDASMLQARREALQARFERVEAALPPTGPYFAGARFSMVDAAFAPVFRYFDVFEQAGQRGFFDAAPKVSAWRRALASRPSVTQAAARDYASLLRQFLVRRPSELGRLVRAADLS